VRGQNATNRGSAGYRTNVLLAAEHRSGTMMHDLA